MTKATLDLSPSLALEAARAEVENPNPSSAVDHPRALGRSPAGPRLTPPLPEVGGPRGNSGARGGGALTFCRASW